MVDLPLPKEVRERYLEIRDATHRVVTIVELLPEDEEPVLHLSLLLAETYDLVRYDLRIDYAQEPPPPFTRVELDWIHERLRHAGLR